MEWWRRLSSRTVEGVGDPVRPGVMTGSCLRRQGSFARPAYVSDALHVQVDGYLQEISFSVKLTFWPPPISKPTSEYTEQVARS
jgi:hypothetical protein